MTFSLCVSLALVCQHLLIGLCIGLEGQGLVLYLREREMKKIIYKQCFCANISLSLLMLVNKKNIFSQSVFL